MNPGDRVVILRPIQPEIIVPCEGTIQVVVPSGDSYQYMLVFDDGNRAMCRAENCYPANWLGLAECMEMPGVLEEDWQGDLRNYSLTESDLPFERWIRLKLDLADHILDGLASFGVMDANIPESLQTALEYYFQVDDDDECQNVEFPQRSPEYEI